MSLYPIRGRGQKWLCFARTQIGGLFVSLCAEGSKKILFFWFWLRRQGQKRLRFVSISIGEIGEIGERRKAEGGSGFSGYAQLPPRGVWLVRQSRRGRGGYYFFHGKGFRKGLH